MHPRNRHREYLDYRCLAERQPSLQRFVFTNSFGTASIDYTDQEALRELTRCLLSDFYQILDWRIPDGYLCPPVPQRADYIHRVADLLLVPGPSAECDEVPARGAAVRGIDVGTGAGCIYCLLGAREYGWSFIGSDIDAGALESARRIVDQNGLHRQIELRQQVNAHSVFAGVLGSGESVAFCVCNPPFHESLEQARLAAEGKWRRLGRADQGGDKNYQGRANEVCCEGGEVGFIGRMADESAEPHVRGSCIWFSSLVSRESSIAPIRLRLGELGARRKCVELKQGRVTKWVIFWTFLQREERGARLAAMQASPARKKRNRKRSLDSQLAEGS